MNCRREGVNDNEDESEGDCDLPEDSFFGISFFS